ncbi:hypothetical protein INS49_002526 [Diaporthe citri]|uniref:uncharacterized protein n=1 Tax=Diaporthe citri TaxID=83186 RepID=UPI001C821A94|nr:uncharacterized protein INS49_002526 [Diaporthe citri]KAG6368321.1 hypothetical protein INS49_002526 [Diaporthe citri]
MALAMLLAVFLGVLHLLAGVCDADVVDDDLMNLQAFIYTNPYPIAKPYDCSVIAALATKGQCMSYIGTDENPLESLASCELYCYETAYANTWDCIAPAIDYSNPDWANIFTDQSLFQWTPGTCSCSNSSDPTPSVNGDDDYPLASLSKGVAVKVATQYPRDLATYGYQVTPGYTDFIDPQVNWDFATIDWLGENGASTRIGIFGVMNNGANPNVLRIHEAWAGRDRRPNGVRAAFHDDVISFWRLTPMFRNLNTLTEIRFDTVIEDSLDALAPWAYLTMGMDPNSGLVVRRNGVRVNEQHVFRTILARARFARRMQQAINEYVEFSHRRIMAFYFTSGMPGFDFAIYFDGYNEATIGDATWNWQ